MSQLDIASDFKYITSEEHQRLEMLIEEDAHILCGYRASLLSKH